MGKSDKNANPTGSDAEQQTPRKTSTSERLDELFKEFKTNLQDASRDASLILRQLEELKRSVELEIEETKRTFENQQFFGTWSKHKLSDGVLIPPDCYVPKGDDYQTIALYRKPDTDSDL